ncbi:MAG TPA: PKD domain-containing protein [Solirubrobacteraceae bacterium]|nr:PKD domain-containing protein [Solirubrobacteraceae bacterium]
MRRALLTILASVVSLLAMSGAAQAVVVDMHALGQTTVPFSASNVSNYAGVNLLPGDCSDLTSPGSTCRLLSKAGVPTVTSTATSSLQCDPWVASDLTFSVPSAGLCSHGGDVMTANQTFALTWDPNRTYYSGTRNYVEQFLRDVADGSGALTSPYAVTPQYKGPNGAAQNKSKFGGGCIDYGSVGGSCYFNTTVPGNDFPANGCQPAGHSFTGFSNVPGTNTVCLTDSQIQTELLSKIRQTDLTHHTVPGYTPLVTMLLPPGVEACLDPTNKLCSANAALAPPLNTPTSSATGGAVAPGTYNVETTYATASGESAPSAPMLVTVAPPTAPASGGSGSPSPPPPPSGTITVPSPPPASGATGYYVYITQSGGTAFMRQAGPIPIGTPYSLSAAPITGPSPSLPLFFCSYHSQLPVTLADGSTQEVQYVVQPWTADTACDEPGLPLGGNTPDELSKNIADVLVSPLSAAQIASIVNPGINGWFALNGSEINDRVLSDPARGIQPAGCVPLGGAFDTVQVGSNSYILQREFNNAAAIETEPYTLGDLLPIQYDGCANGVVLSPHFVVPNAIEPGDEVWLDGSTTSSTLMVPNAGYQWNLGDGSAGSGASVVHVFQKPGSYTVTLNVTDRGGNPATISQTIQVLLPNGQPYSPPPATQRLQARIHLIPQSLAHALHGGIAAVLNSNEAADGFASVLISRAVAKRAHIQAGRGPSVVIGRGTISGIKGGVVTLHLRLSRTIAAKLARLRHVTLTVHLMLIGATGGRLRIDVAGRY